MSSHLFAGIARFVYETIRFPCLPFYWGFPVKLITHVGEPIPYVEGKEYRELAIEVRVGSEEEKTAPSAEFLLI